ncbi:MAG: hypothetical protein IPJ20_19720 [Flammeovirgaceae bacterium]|nr:hypothetical protein [Flammeovirgaceae bacterium]
MKEKTELAKVANATIPVQVAVTKREALGGSFTAGSFRHPDKSLFPLKRLASL